MSASDVVGGLWDRVTGELWEWEWSTTDDVSGWAGPVEVSVRVGDDSSDREVASTADGSVTTTGTDFPAGALCWQVPAAVTAELTAGTYWVHVRAVVDGVARTVLLREFVVRSGLVTS